MKAWPLPGFKMAAGTVPLLPEVRGVAQRFRTLVKLPTARPRPVQGAGLTATQLPVPAVPGAGSRWRKMRTEAGSRREQRIEWELWLRGPGLGFASEAVEPP